MSNIKHRISQHCTGVGGGVKPAVLRSGFSEYYFQCIIRVSCSGLSRPDTLHCEYWQYIICVAVPGHNNAPSSHQCVALLITAQIYLIAYKISLLSTTAGCADTVTRAFSSLSQSSYVGGKILHSDNPFYFIVVFQRSFASFHSSSSMNSTTVHHIYNPKML